MLKKSSFALVSALLLATQFAHAAEQNYSLKVVAQDFVSPLVLLSLPGSGGKVLIVDQPGTIRILGADGKLLEQPFLDLRDRMAKLKGGFDERGLLGLALHPRFKENGKVYVFYNAPLRKEAPAGWDDTAHLSECKVMANDPLKVNPGSEKILLQIDKPFFNHNSGRILFGPDDYLYIGVGDGGGNGGDVGMGHSPQGNGQDTSVLLAKILRIDVDHGTPYAVPPDNPFVGGKGRPEIFAYGVRNPWGISFDRGGRHELFAVDVGQDLWEEVNIIVKGGNYGWNVREGFQCFNPKAFKKPPPDCPTSGVDGKPFIDPILAYAHPTGGQGGEGTSITGGYVYRGKALPELDGKYIFADWSRNFGIGQGVLFVATRPTDGSAKWSLNHLPLQEAPNGQLKLFVVAMGEDAEGELYVMTTANNAMAGTTGKVHKLVRAGASN